MAIRLGQKPTAKISGIGCITGNLKGPAKTAAEDLFRVAFDG
jgi:hypothetical protein